MKNLINLKNSKTILLSIIILIGIFFRFYNYNLQDFWWDELMEFTTVNPYLTLSETYQLAHSLTIGTHLEYDFATNANFYFYIFKFFLGLFSYTPGTARLIVVFFGIFVFLLSIYIYYKYIGKNLFVFSIIIASNYYLIIQSQEFKYNIFFCLISLISILFFFMFIKNKDSKYKKLIKFFYFLSIFLTVWTHIFGFIIFFSQLLCLLIKERNILINNFFYYLSLPFLYFLVNFKQLLNFSKIEKFHIPELQKEFFLDYNFKYFFGSNISGKIFLCIFLLLFIFNYKKLFKSKFEISFLIILILMTYLLPIIYSFISKPILETRYIIYIVPCLIFLLVYMVDLINTKFIKLIIVSTLIFLTTSNTIYSLYFLKKNDKPHLTEVLKKINEHNSNKESYVVISNSYLLNYTTKKTKFKNLNLNFISCEDLNSINVKSWWEISIFPGDRFPGCNKKLSDPNQFIKEAKIIKKINAKYADGYLIVKN